MADCVDCVKGRYGLLEKIVTGCLLVIAVNSMVVWKDAKAKDLTDREQSTELALGKQQQANVSAFMLATNVKLDRLILLNGETNLQLQTHIAGTSRRRADDRNRDQ